MLITLTSISTSISCEMYTFTGIYSISHIHRARHCVNAVSLCFFVCCVEETTTIHSFTQHYLRLCLCLSALFFFLLPPPDVWNVYSHMECVCKSHGNQISLIPGGLNKVAFVCLCVYDCVFCLCAYTITQLHYYTQRGKLCIVM